ncbi:MAG TPA: hypothetical protein VGR43_06000, partial [Dehalococcoidia bacterium]|nr:hypothetical protein [Dehalococcoidia bacterium]
LRKSRLDVWASLDFVNGDLTDKRTGLKVPLPFVSREKVKLGVTYNYRDQFVVTPTVSWIGQSHSFTINPSSPFFGKTAVPGYTLVNLYVERRNIAKNTSLFVRVSNLLNRRYFNAGSAGGFSFLRAPQEQRWLTAGITHTY